MQKRWGEAAPDRRYGMRRGVLFGEVAHPVWLPGLCFLCGLLFKIGSLGDTIGPGISHEGRKSLMNPVSAQILKAILCDGKVWLNYQLGVADGITLLSRRGDEAEFTAIAEDEPAPVVDARPKLDSTQPETRRYRAILSYRTNAMCQLSNEVTFTLP